MGYHIPVMLKESMEALKIKRDGWYVDVTFGGGGHSREILKRLLNGKLLAIDCDEDSFKNKINDKRFMLIRENFKNLKHVLEVNEMLPADGIICDLGISSYQIDCPDRGFSYQLSDYLDMRMDNRLTTTACTILNKYNETELNRIFKEYGELKNYKSITKAIINFRNINPIQSKYDLLAAIKPTTPIYNNIQFLSKVYQALRIEVNRELENLKQFLTQSQEVLKPGGRLVVLTYHSLEDRLVKNFIQNGNFTNSPETDIYGNKITPFNKVLNKPLTPDSEEIKKNSRSRSAKLRAAEKN